jgi:hypothetical protein
MSLPVLFYPCLFLFLMITIAHQKYAVVSVMKIVNLCADSNVRTLFCTPVSYTGKQAQKKKNIYIYIYIYIYIKRVFVPVIEFISKMFFKLFFLKH